MTKNLIVIGGPTAAGKTDLGRLIAEKYNGQVVSVDSRQIYQGLDIGTGKDLTFKQEMIDILPPGINYSAAEFASQSEIIIRQLLSKKLLPVLVGGTGYYMDAIIYKKYFPPLPNPDLLAKLEKKSDSYLGQKLTELDPASYNRTRDNRRRMIRALEIIISSGRPVPKQKLLPRYNHFLIILDPGKEQVNDNIYRRLKLRIENGMIEEVENLRQNVDHQWLESLGLEYKFISLYLDEKLTYDEMLEDLEKASCQYARRQRVWWKRYPKAIWVKNLKEGLKEADSFINSLKEVE